MSIQTVTTILTDPESASVHLTAATDFARAYDAHLHVLAMGIGFDHPGIVQTALDAVPVPSTFADSHQCAADIAAMVSKQLSSEDIRWDVDPIATVASHSGQDIVKHTKFSDLVIQHRIADPSYLDQNSKIAEIVLFDSHAPLLVLPPTSAIEAPADKIMVAWDDSATALRAARLALPLLRAAQSVHVALVDPSKDAPDRSDPGGEFAQFLSRHGIKNEVSVLNQTDGSVAETIERRANELGCNMVVMGAYGHSRLRQAIFGGTTRSMLEKAGIPVLLAH